MVQSETLLTRLSEWQISCCKMRIDKILFFSSLHVWRLFDSEVPWSCTSGLNLPMLEDSLVIHLRLVSVVFLRTAGLPFHFRSSCCGDYVSKNLIFSRRQQQAVCYCPSGGNSTVLRDLSFSFLPHFFKNSFTETLNKFADNVPGIGTFGINKFRTIFLAATMALKPVRSKVLPLQG